VGEGTSKKPGRILYTVDVDAYTAWLTANGYTQELMPRKGQVFLWLASYRRSDGALKPDDWFCRIRDPENPAFKIELPFAFLVQVAHQ
jgi:hypothetical protein